MDDTQERPSSEIEEEPVIDVHPPHAAMHSWRDFFIHIATITIGLLIAVALEGGVEALHHRHIVREARENIRRELEGNEKQVGINLADVQQDADRMTTNLRLLGEMLHDPHAHRSMSYQFRWSSFNDSAWRSARDSGALTYMPVTEVQTYADCYMQQELVNTQAVAIFAFQVDLTAPLRLNPDNQPAAPEDLQSVRHGTGTAYMRLVALTQLIEQLKLEYADTLGK